MARALDKLRELAAETTDLERPFGKYEEEAIISLAIDHPEFFTAIGQFIKPEMFSRLECQYLVSKILNAYEQFNVIPNRQILKDQISKELTADDPFEPILEILDKKSDPRDVPIIKDTLLKWARDRAFGLLYSEEAQDAYARGDYTYLENLLNQANRIADVGANGFWFFESLELLFQDDIIEHKTTGFPKLDEVLNNGGPGPKEVVCFMAPTNVGKCLTLDSLIIEKNLSRIFDIELEDGTIIKLPGFTKIHTTRGLVKVCDLADGDTITEESIKSLRFNGMQNLRIKHEDGFSIKIDDDPLT